MKKLLLLLSLLIGSNLIALEKEVSSSFESTWSKVLLLMSAEGTKISFIDKSSGLLQASTTVPKGKGFLYYHECKYPGALISSTSNISVVVQEISKDQSKITINSKWVIESYLQSRLLFIKLSKTNYHTNCVSNGRLEEKLLSSFSKF